MRDYFKVQPTLSQLIELRAEEIGYGQAYREAYGEFPEVTPREFARELRDQGLSYEDISNFVVLRFGVGCKSVVVRWLNDSAYAKHLTYKRKKK